MSTLKQKVSAQLDQFFPPEYDEAWVDTLLTETDNSTIELLKKIRHERHSQTKKVAPQTNKISTTQQSSDSKNKDTDLSAIQKQIKAYQQPENKESSCC